ncbi:CPBP family intramembrane glutamic endopeptidase [Alkalicoccus halolimnae]|uniref:CPBP family intramembrane glutamic endopeptidase n=1 Tax=Alkalicoccus halolimnae TaxID=1667239 RepID=A0A5C7F2P0_9BACI|nr:CPBP family intramembrane glutamic endopeptidase [Alkalicoccus halolimnae]TXF83031.1 CPBP family intramembrane metalloprotease [Alkalicoccus halolimnae]
MNNQARIIDQLSDKELYVNLYMTQGIIFCAALLGAWILQSSILAPFLLIDFTWSAASAGLLFAGIILLLEVLFTYTLPEKWFDDGGINVRIFKNMPAHLIVLVSGIVALSEELLFRGVLQTEFGIVVSSLIFALIHLRYLKKVFLFSFVLAMSFGLGFLFMWTGNLWSVIVAHFVIDSVLGLLIRYRHIRK